MRGGAHEAGLHELIDGIYERGLEFSEWPLLLDEIAAAFGCTKSGYILFDRDDSWRAVSIGRHPEADSPKMKECLQAYLDLPPGGDLMLRNLDAFAGGRRGVVIGHKIVDRDEFLASRHYLEVLEPAKMFDHLIMPIGQPDGALGSLVLYSDGPDRLFSDLDRVRFLTLRPHFMRVIQMQARVQHALNLSALASAALDALQFGVILAGADGKIEFANRQALSHLETRRFIEERRGLLRIRTAGRQEELVRALGRACGVSFERGENHLSGSGLLLTDEGCDGRLILHIFPLSPQSAARISAHNRCALVALIDPECVAPAADRLLKLIFGFTHKEAVLAQHLAAGLSLKDSADLMAITRPTARWHLKRILSKSGFDRQGALVAALGRISAPIETSRRGRHDDVPSG